MTLNELIAALERAEGPSWDLDGQIADALGLQMPDDETVKPWQWPPRYTSSIDAALTLVPEDWKWAVSWGGAHVWRHLEDYPLPGTQILAQHTTPAIALCIAALKARANANP